MSSAQVDTGLIVSGLGIAANTVVISQSTLALNSPRRFLLDTKLTADVPDGTTLTFDPKGIYTAKTAGVIALGTTITVSANLNVKVGDKIFGPGIAAGTTVDQAGFSTSVSIDKTTTASIPNDETLTFVRLDCSKPAACLTNMDLDALPVFSQERQLASAVGAGSTSMTLTAAITLNVGDRIYATGLAPVSTGWVRERGVRRFPWAHL